MLWQLLRRSPTRFLIGTIIGTVIGFSCAKLVSAWVVSQSSLLVTDAHQVASETDNTIAIQFRFTRVEQCITQSVTREIWAPRPDLDDPTRLSKYIVPLPNAPSITIRRGAAKSFSQTATFVFTVPASVRAGRWYYQQVATDYCGWMPSIFGPIVRESDDIPIDIPGPVVGERPLEHGFVPPK